jgi:serine/threonine protein kinase
MAVVLMILKPIASALNYAHSQKIIHCDVKPANILINQNSKVMLTDFGISKQVSQRTTGGTPPYMAPEQFTGERLTPQTDIYGLGVSLYEMLSGGQVPYRGNASQTRSTTLRDRIHWEVMNVPYPELSQYNKSIPSGVENAIKKALNKNPALRFHNALEFFSAIEQASGGAASSSDDVIQNYLTDLHRLATKPKPISLPPNPQVDQHVSLHLDDKAQVLPKLPRNFHGAFLFAMQGDLEGLFILIQHPTFTIGRSSQSVLPLQERSVSRSHAVIQKTQKGIFIQDEGSKLGTYVNGQLIRDSYRLESGDVIQIGYEQVFEIHIR